MRCLHAGHLRQLAGLDNGDEVRFADAVRLRRMSVVPKGKRPHPDTKPDFVSITQESAFELEMFYEPSEGVAVSVVPVDESESSACPEGMGRLSPYFKAQVGVTYNLPQEVVTTRVSLRGQYTVLSICFYGMLDEDEKEPEEVEWVAHWPGWPKLPTGAWNHQVQKVADSTDIAYSPQLRDSLSACSRRTREAWWRVVELADGDARESLVKAIGEAVEDLKAEKPTTAPPEAAGEALASCLALEQLDRELRREVLAAAVVVFERSPEARIFGLAECCGKALRDRFASPRTIEAAAALAAAASNSNNVEAWIATCHDAAWRRYARPADFPCAPSDALRQSLELYLARCAFRGALEALGAAACEIVTFTSEEWPAVRQAARAAEACAALYQDDYHNAELVSAAVGCAACAACAVPDSIALWTATRRLIIRAMLARRNSLLSAEVQRSVVRVLQQTADDRSTALAATSLLPLEFETPSGLATVLERRLRATSLVRKVADAEKRKRMSLPDEADDTPVLLERAHAVAAAGDDALPSWLLEDDDARFAVLRQLTKHDPIAIALVHQAWLSADLSLAARRAVDDAVIPDVGKRAKLQLLEDNSSGPELSSLRRLVEATREIYDDDDALIRACVSQDDDQASVGWARLSKRLDEPVADTEVVVSKALHSRLLDCPRRDPYAPSAFGTLETAARALRSLRLKQPFDHIPDPSLHLSSLDHRPPVVELVRYFQMRVDVPLYDDDDDDAADLHGNGVSTKRTDERLAGMRRTLLAATRAVGVADRLLARGASSGSSFRDEAPAAMCCLRLLSELSLASPRPLTQTDRDQPAAQSLLGEQGAGTTPFSRLASTLCLRTTRLLASRFAPRPLLRYILEHGAAHPRNRLAALQTLRALLPPRGPVAVLAIAERVVEPLSARALSLDDNAKRAALAFALDASLAHQAQAAAERALAHHRATWRDAIAAESDLTQHHQHDLLRLLVLCCQSASTLIRSCAADVTCRVVDLGGRGAVRLTGLLCNELRAASAAAKRQLAAANSSSASIPKEDKTTRKEWARVGRLLSSIRELCIADSRFVFASGIALALIETLGIAKPEVLRLALESIATLITTKGQVVGDQYASDIGRRFSADALVSSGTGARNQSPGRCTSELLVRSLHKVLTKYHRADLHVHAAAARCLTLLARSDEASDAAGRVLRVLETKGAVKRALAGLATTLGVADAPNKWRVARALRAAAWLAHVPAALAWDAGFDSKRVADLVDDEAIDQFARALADITREDHDYDDDMVQAYVKIAERTSSELVDLRRQDALEARRSLVKDQISAMSDAELSAVARRRADFLVESALTARPRNYTPALAVQSTTICGVYDEDEPPPTPRSLIMAAELAVVPANDHCSVLGAAITAPSSRVWDAEDAARHLSCMALTDVPLDAVRAALRDLTPAANDAIKAETKRLAVNRRAKALPDADPFVEPPRARETPPLPEPPSPSTDTVPTDPRRRRAGAPPDAPPPVFSPLPPRGILPTPSDRPGRPAWGELPFAPQPPRLFPGQLRPPRPIPTRGAGGRKEAPGQMAIALPRPRLAPPPMPPPTNNGPLTAFSASPTPMPASNIEKRPPSATPAAPRAVDPRRRKRTTPAV